MNRIGLRFVWAGVGVLLAAGAAAGGSPFPVGEELVYRIHWGAIPIAESRITSEFVKEDGRDLVLVRMKTRTNKWMDRIHRVDDQVETFMAPDTLRPVRFVEQVREKDNTAEEVTVFDHANAVAHWQSSLTGRSTNYAIRPDTRDIVSFLYFMRAQSLAPGTSTNVTISAYQSLSELRVNSVKSQDVHLAGYGDVPSVLMKPEAVTASLFARKAPQKVWVSTDPRHLVTRMDARVPVGTVHVTLFEVKGPGDDFWVKKR